MEVIDVFRTENTQKIKKIAQKFVDKLKTLPATGKYMDEISAVKIIDEWHEEDMMGCYTPATKEIFLVADAFLKRVKEEDLEKNICYVIIHELGHKVADKLSPINRDYDAVKKNKAYYKEELRADSFAKAVVKKYFSEIKGMLELATERVNYILKRFKNFSEKHYDYFNNSYTCDYTIKSSSNWRDWNYTTTSNSTSWNSNLILAC